MVGHVNITAMSAVSVANSIFIVFLVLGMGTIAASAPLIASSKAARSYSECGEILRSAIELSFIIAFIITSSLLIISENIHLLNGFFKESEEVLDLVQVYLRLVAISTIPYMLFLAVKQFGDGLSVTKPAMIITLMGVVLNIFLNVVLMYGKLSFPPMGVKGLALSTIITRSFMALALIIVVFNNVGFKDFLPPLISRFNTWPVLVKIVKIGLPGGIQLFFEVGAFTAAGFMAMKLGGTHYVAAHAVAHTLSSVTYMLAMGISIAGSILVGKAFGNNDKDKILIAGKSVIICGVLFMAFWAFVFFVFGEDLTILIVGHSDPELMSISRAVLIVVGIYQLFDGLQVVGLGILRGIEDVNKPTIITLVAYWLVALPCSYVFGFYMDYKLTGIWLGLMVGLMVSAILLNYRFFRLVLTGKMSQYQSTDLKDLN
jgi:multidrug resistance protein, MATE family